MQVQNWSTAEPSNNVDTQFLNISHILLFPVSRNTAKVTTTQKKNNVTK
jgi:hypothetical protein